MRFNPPDDQAFHEAFYRGMNHGDVSNVATLVGKHRSQLSRELNPDEPPRSAPYQALVEMEAWRIVNFEQFEVLADAMTEFIVSRRFAGLGKGAGAETIHRLCSDLTRYLWLLEKGEASQEDVASAACKLQAVLGTLMRPERRGMEAV